MLAETLQRVKCSDPAQGRWDMDGNQAVVWVDASSLAIRAVQEVNGNIVEDVCWLRQNGCSHINLAELDALLRGVNLVVVWKMKRLLLMTDSKTVYYWLMDALSGRSRLKKKAASEMLIRWRPETMKIVKSTRPSIASVMPRGDDPSSAPVNQIFRCEVKLLGMDGVSEHDWSEKVQHRLTVGDRVWVRHEQMMQRSQLHWIGDLGLLCAECRIRRFLNKYCLPEFQALLNPRQSSGVVLLFDYLHSVHAFTFSVNTLRYSFPATLNRLRQLSWCMTVVVVSDDPAFLAAFAQSSLKDRLLVWSTRLLAVTRLPLLELQDLHTTFSMLNAMMLIIDDVNISTRCSVYIHLPYSPQGSHSILVASWTPQGGITLTTDHLLFPEKFSKLLHGPKLVVVAEEFQPHTALVKDTVEGADGEHIISFTGPIVNLLQLIAESINFTYTFIRPPDGSWGTKEVDGSYSGMVGMVHRKEADLGMGPFGLSAIRSEVVDFTIPILIDTVRVLAGRGRPEVDPWGFLLPFASLVWATILTTLILVPTAISLLSSRMTLNNKDSKTIDIFFGYLRIILQQDFFVPSERWWKRMAFAGWMMATVVFTRSYASTLMSLLAVRHILHPYQSLREVLDDSSITMIWEPNTVYVELFRLTSSGILSEVAEMDRAGLIRYHTTIEFPHVVDTLVREGSHVLVTEDLTEKLRLAQDFSETGRCDFYSSRERILPFMFCMIGQKKSPLVPLMSDSFENDPIYTFGQNSLDTFGKTLHLADFVNI
ncbi:uncharacterized protein [Panulirus ornatus]|uniref:uncharacterized protein n=1 Tax=Panulirus ornatus TaxID=150431 RepID=UPI003A866DD3